jgi:hypothetical protein
MRCAECKRNDRYSFAGTPYAMIVDLRLRIKDSRRIIPDAEKILENVHGSCIEN